MTEQPKRNSWNPFAGRASSVDDSIATAPTGSAESIKLGLDPEAHARALLAELQRLGITGVVPACNVMREWKIISEAGNWPELSWLTVSRPFGRLCAGKRARSVSDGGRSIRLVCYLVPERGTAAAPMRPPVSLTARITRLERQVAALVEARAP